MYLFIPSDQNTTAFKEVAIIRHPRVGEYAFGFITSSVTLQVIMSVCQRVTKSFFSFLLKYYQRGFFFLSLWGPYLNWEFPYCCEMPVSIVISNLQGCCSFTKLAQLSQISKCNINSIGTKTNSEVLKEANKYRKFACWSFKHTIQLHMFRQCDASLWLTVFYNFVSSLFLIAARNFTENQY